MSTIDRISELEKKASQKAIATKIFDTFKKLRLENDDNSSKRWIWELLQNAKDCAFENHKVSVNINLDKDKKVVEFSHNAQPFTLEQVTFLINQVSTKERGDTTTKKTTGKFGTGFLSTHLLSEIVELNSIVSDTDMPYKKFQITLDRSGRDLDSISAAITESFAQLAKIDEEKPIDNFDESKLNTKFTYKLSEQGLTIAEQGLKDFKASIFYVLIFIKNIHSVRLEHEDREFVLSEEEIQIDEKTKRYLVLEKAQETICRHEIIVVSEDYVSIAMPVINDGDIFFDTLKEKSAKLFCDFPLSGTEGFPFPAVINCSNFNPTEPRDGVYLTDKEDIEITENKDIVKKACDLLKYLIDLASVKNWGKMYALAQFPQNFEAKWVDSKWLKEEVVGAIISKLLVTPIIDTLDNKRKAILSADNKLNVWFPADSKSEVREKIWELYSKFIPSILPSKNEIHEWYISVVSNKTKLIVEEAFKDISDKKSVEEISNDLNEGIDVFDWLNDFYFLVEISKNISFFDDDKYKVLPNQNGFFACKKNLKLGESIESEIKEALVLLGNDIRNTLLHERVKLTENINFVELSQQEVVSNINTLLKRELPENTLQSCKLLLSLVPDDRGEAKGHKKLYEFYSKIDPTFSKPRKTISNWTPEIWEVSDRIIVYYIANEISKCESIKMFADMIECNEKDAIAWIDSFVEYLVQNEFLAVVSKKAFLPNQNGDFRIRENLRLDDGEICDELKDICAELGDDFRDSLLDKRIFLEMPDAYVVNEGKIAAQIMELAKNLFSSPRTEEIKKTFKKLFIWFTQNSEKAKRLFDRFYENKYKLCDDNEIAESFQKGEEISELLDEYGINNIQQLKQIVEKAMYVDPVEDNILRADERVVDTKREITREDLLQYGISTKEELEKAFEIREFSEQFIHRTTSSFEMLQYAQGLILRAKANIKKYLEGLKDYDCSEVEEIAPTIIGGIKKNGAQIMVVTRPSDSGQVLIYYSSEKDALDCDNAELWVEDGRSIPQRLTLGGILKSTGINRIPIYK